MTGPEHYRAAEELLALAEDHQTYPDTPNHHVNRLHAAAQVHATLAQAAAIAELDAYGMADGCATGRTNERANAWSAVLAAEVSL